jgi:TonB family protein
LSPPAGKVTNLGKEEGIVRIEFILLALFSLLQTQIASPQLCVVHLQAPEYPLLARQTGMEGRVEVTIRISQDGEVTIVGEPQGNRLLAGYAASNLKTWKCSPANNAAPADLTVTYEYRLDQLHKTQNTVFGSTVEMDLPGHVLIVAPGFDCCSSGDGNYKKPWWKKIF